MNLAKTVRKPRGGSIPWGRRVKLILSLPHATPGYAVFLIALEVEANFARLHNHEHRFNHRER
jgi:hypothetical protein